MQPLKKPRRTALCNTDNTLQSPLRVWVLDAYHVSHWPQLQCSSAPAFSPIDTVSRRGPIVYSVLFLSTSHKFASLKALAYVGKRNVIDSNERDAQRQPHVTQVKYTFCIGRSFLSFSMLLNTSVSQIKTRRRLNILPKL